MKTMFTVWSRSFLVACALNLALQSGRGQLATVYDSLNGGATAATSQAASGDPIYGDMITLAAGGKLVNFGAALFNSSSGGNVGTIFAGNMTIRFYDNTITYAGGPITNPLLGTATLSWDFNDEGGLGPGFYDTQTADLSALNIVLPAHVLVTQEFSQTDGDSTRWGIVLGTVSSVGSSPSTYFLSSGTTSPGLVTTAGNPGEVAYQIDVITNGPNHQPVASPQSVSVLENNSLPITLTGGDADNDPLTFSVATNPSHGSLSGTAPNLVYQPNASYAGPDSFTFIVNDGHTNSTPATVSITVNAPAGLVIIPVWDSSIQNDPNAAAIENTINSAIQAYEATFSDPITVTITFAEMGSGLGMSSTYGGTVSYQSVYNALVSDAKTVNDATALAHIPSGTINPVDGSSSVHLATANQRALGINGNPPPGQSDSTIFVNMSIINIDRVTINPSHYDLMAVVSHEIDEALGTASGLGDPNSSAVDFFRYSSSGARSYTTSGDDAYLSIDGGVTDLVRYNQSATGDYGDWWSTGAHTPRVQDAFGTAGATPNLGVELTLLDVIGYNLVTVPPAAPAIKSSGVSGGTFSLSWSSIAGRSYQVQYRTNITQVGWINLGSPVTANSTIASTTDSIGSNARRYYRVGLVPSASPSFRANLGASGPQTLVTKYYLPAPDMPSEVESARPLRGGVGRLKAQK